MNYSKSEISPDGLSVAATLQNLREKRLVPDHEFDLILPESARKHSMLHWTPMEVLFRAVELLVVNSKTRVLDLGSGCGKFCVVGSLISEGSFSGVEQRDWLVSVAAKLASVCGAERTSFIHANIEEIDWSRYNAFYFYNPFCENLYPVELAIDSSINITADLYKKYVRLTRKRLRQAAIGTRVVTYQGFGGSFPPGFQKVFVQDYGGRELALWIKCRDQWQRPDIQLLGAKPGLPSGNTTND